MKKNISIVLILCLSAFAALAQKQGQERIDSLLEKLPELAEDTNKVTLLNDLCFTYYSINPDEGLKYGNLALTLSEKLQWKYGIAQANSRMGANYFGKADLPNALIYWLNAVKLNEEINNKRSVGINLGNIGNIYLQQSEFEKALDYYFKASKINEEVGNKSALALNLGNIGSVYGQQLQYQQALGYFLKALKIHEELQDPSGIARSSISIGNVYQGFKEYFKALEYNFKALKIVREAGVSNLVATCHTNIGKMYLELVIDSNKTQLNKIFGGNKKEALLMAKAFMDSAVVSFKEIGDLSALYQTYQSLSDIQSLMGDKAGALESYKKYSLYKDSVFNMEKNKKITETAMQYEFDKKEAATKADQEKKDIRQKNIRNSITVGLVSALVFLIVVYRQRNKIKAGKKRSDELLLNILPAEVAEELKAKGSADAKHFDEVTVMFTDFKGFTQISEKLSATELVNEIHNCFKAFDDIISEHNIEKIKTIGDSYMCAGGLPVANTTNATDVVNAAVEIQKFMFEHLRQRKSEGKEIFEIRIGIHTGPVVAGIVGVKKFAYDIWGDTVNIASRMESSGEAGKVNISGSTYELVKDKFKCDYRGEIEAKGKGKVKMYFVS